MIADALTPMRGGRSSTDVWRHTAAIGVRTSDLRVPGWSLVSETRVRMAAQRKEAARMGLTQRTEVETITTKSYRSLYRGATLLWLRRFMRTVFG